MGLEGFKSSVLSVGCFSCTYPAPSAWGAKSRNNPGVTRDEIMGSCSLPYLPSLKEGNKGEMFGPFTRNNYRLCSAIEAALQSSLRIASVKEPKAKQGREE